MNRREDKLKSQKERSSYHQGRARIFDGPTHKVDPEMYRVVVMIVIQSIREFPYTCPEQYAYFSPWIS